MMAFRKVLDDLELENLGFEGHCFTWKRGRSRKNWVMERLDRAVVNQSWKDLFPHFKVPNLVSSRSDHSPIVVDTLGNQPKEETFWMQRAKFHGLHDQIEKLTTNLQATQDNKTNDENDRTEEELRSKLDDFLQKEETFWMQRAKMNWLRERDKNTNFFIPKPLKGERGTLFQTWRMKRVCGVLRKRRLKALLRPIFNTSSRHNNRMALRNFLGQLTSVSHLR
ncbi:hypothetical protein PTKIN_Ptkin05aG0033900 [Pterospermum kingtungense]